MKYHTTQSGFTLVETLVAISILLIVMIGPMTISSSAARSTSFSSEQVTAFFLAQEGAELAQKARDDLLLQYFADANNNGQPDNPNPWTDFTKQNSGGADQAPMRLCYRRSGCSLSINGSDVVADGRCSATGGVNSTDASRCRLYLNTTAAATRARYTVAPANGALPAGYVETPFTRQIILDAVSGSGGDEISVISKVTWRSGSLRQEQVVEVETRLFNIYGN